MTHTLLLAACVEGDPAQTTASSDQGETGTADTDDGATDDSEVIVCDGGPYAVAYAEPVMLIAGTNPRGVTLGDVDDDGKLDVLATARDDRELLVFLGAGDGSFAAPVVTELPDGAFPEAVRGGAIADGVFDVVSRVMTDTTTLVRMRGDGSGGFHDYEALLVSSPIFVLDELTGDAALDVVLPTPGALLVYPGSVAQESFMPPSPITSSGEWATPGAVGVGDFDGDGDVDVAVASLTGLHVGLNDGAAVFSFVEPLDFDGSPSDIESGDLDGDGDVEIVLTTYGGGSADGGHVFRGRGDGTFEADELIVAPKSPICVDVADIDEDGRDDVAMVGSEAMAVYLSTGDGLGPAMQISCAGANPRQLSLGDLNGDCVEDAVTVTDEGVCIMMSTSP